MTDLLVHPASAPLRGVVPCPADAVTAELALVLAAVSSGRTRLAARGLPRLTACDALTRWGVSSAQDDEGIEVMGVGLDGLRRSDEVIDAGPNAWLSAALMAVAAAQPFETTLVASADPRSLACAAASLRRRGAQVEGQLDPSAPDRLSPPLTILPAAAGMSDASYELAAGREASKVAALFSGLFADGPTWIREPLVVSDRVERLFGFAELPLRAAGGMLQLEPGAAPRAFADALPGDSSVGWALLAAALGAPDSVVGVRAMAIGPCRSGLSNALSRAGGSLHIEPKRARLGEPSADVTLRAGELGALCLEGELGLRAGAALPVACALAASATGHSRLADIATSVEQRQRTLSMLDAYGVRAASWGNGIELWGSFDRPRAAELDCRGDAALAMAATVLGLRAAGPCRIRGADCIVESAPRFVGSLRALGANIDVLPAGRPA